MNILRSLRKDGYTQVEIDHLFKAIVLPKITYALPVYGWSQPGRFKHHTMFFKRCNKRPYTFELSNIYDVLEKCDRRLSTKIKNNVNHPSYAYSLFAESQRVIQEIDCKTVRIFAYSSTREQSNKGLE